MSNVSAELYLLTANIHNFLSLMPNDLQLLVCKGEDTQWFSLLSPHPATVSQGIWTKSLKEVHATRIPTKLSTLSKACDVKWTEKCKQTSADSSISSVPFVLNIYKK